MSLKEQFEIDSEEELKEPSMFKVILLNDDYTSMDFVVDILINIFNHDNKEAVKIMLDIHKKGRGVCGVYTKEIAETKVLQVAHEAAKNEFPLRADLEEV